MSEIDVTIDDWQQWTDDEIVDRHRCSLIPNDEIGVMLRTAGQSGPEGWILASIDPATEEDVRKGIAPELEVPSMLGDHDSLLPVLRHCPGVNVTATRGLSLDVAAENRETAFLRPRRRTTAFS